MDGLRTCKLSSRAACLRWTNLRYGRCSGLTPLDLCLRIILGAGSVSSFGLITRGDGVASRARDFNREDRKGSARIAKEELLGALGDFLSVLCGLRFSTVIVALLAVVVP